MKIEVYFFNNNIEKLLIKNEAEKSPGAFKPIHKFTIRIAQNDQKPDNFVEILLKSTQH